MDAVGILLSALNSQHRVSNGFMVYSCPTGHPVRATFYLLNELWTCRPVPRCQMSAYSACCSGVDRIYGAFMKLAYTLRNLYEAVNSSDLSRTGRIAGFITQEESNCPSNLLGLTQPTEWQCFVCVCDGSVLLATIREQSAEHRCLDWA